METGNLCISRGYALRRKSRGWGTEIPSPAMSFPFSLTQGALEIPVSAKPSTGVQPPKGWT